MRSYKIRQLPQMTTRFTLLSNRLKYSAFYRVDAANLPKVAAGRLAVAGALWIDF